MKLFVIYIGGATPTSLIELHDMRFIIAPAIEDTYDILRNTWWGTPQSLHLDAWGELTYADGYDISIQPRGTHQRETTQEKLYFVNLGGYDSQQFTELHKNIFVVAKDKATAKIKAKAQVQHWEVPHTDNQFEIENIIAVEEHLAHSQYYLKLTQTIHPKPFEFICKYTPIGIEEVIS